MSAKESAKSTREKAAAARAEAEAEQKRRDRTVRIIGGLAVLAVIGAIFGAVIWNNKKTASANDVVADASVPKGANTSTGDYPWAYPVNRAGTKPTLAIWEDFQCPTCGAVEKANGKTIEQLASDGKINLIWRPTAFIDEKTSSSAGPNPKSSLRATAAWGCAIDAGKGPEYHNTVFANQPANEGDGWSQQQLIDFGTTAGITGDAQATFKTCVENDTYHAWANNSYQTFIKDAVPGTPTAYLNGKEVTLDVLGDPTKLTKAVADATK